MVPLRPCHIHVCETCGVTPTSTHTLGADKPSHLPFFTFQRHPRKQGCLRTAPPQGQAPGGRLHACGLVTSDSNMVDSGAPRHTTPQHTPQCQGDRWACGLDGTAYGAASCPAAIGAAARDRHACVCAHAAVCVAHMGKAWDARAAPLSPCCGGPTPCPSVETWKHGRETEMRHCNQGQHQHPPCAGATVTGFASALLHTDASRD